MSQKLLLAWAVSATALAFVFLGYALGKRSETVSSAPTLSPHEEPLTDTSGGNPAQQPVEPHVVPTALAGLPTEWHSEFNGKDVRGYAILFDPQHRELIVEQCHHRGYLDQRTGDVFEPGWEFCHNVLWATVVRINERSATVIDQHREPVELAISLNNAGNAPRLSLSFRDHHMTLQPGGKNHYFQAIERTPAMQAQKERFVQMMVTRELATRRLAEETGTAQGAQVPTYSLPAGALAQDEDGQVPQ